MTKIVRLKNTRHLIVIMRVTVFQYGWILQQSKYTFTRYLLTLSICGLLKTFTVMIIPLVLTLWNNFYGSSSQGIIRNLAIIVYVWTFLCGSSTMQPIISQCIGKLQIKQRNNEVHFDPMETDSSFKSSDSYFQRS